MVETAWSLLEKEAPLIREAHVYARLRPDLVGDDWDELIGVSVQSYVKVLDAFADELTITDRDAAARMVFYLMNTGLAEYGLYRDNGPGAALKMDDRDFRQAIARSILGYLKLGQDNP